jgi:deoxyribodipyrimidine photo-lyase
MNRQPIEIVWFKRDLRVLDHAPLAAACARGNPVLPLYIVEPKTVLASPDFDPCHWTFAAASLHDLNRALTALGQPLIVLAGEAVDVFESLFREYTIANLWAHEETGNAATFARDRAVIRWARERGVPLHETPAGGVVRRLKTRDGWSRVWEQRMAAPIVPEPSYVPRLEGAVPPPIPTHRDLGLHPDVRRDAQPGGLRAAHATLDSFLDTRGLHYHREMSSPVTAFDSCSRLSPHLAYGTISTRTVVHRLRERIASAEDASTRRALRAFDARLHWRDHFMQKLEDEPAIEFHNFVRGFDGLREDDFSQDLFEAWKQGRTGYPMIDACMRCLNATGWINFRMRAMLMSFAAYHLWLHWREPGLHLARTFVDYEPGIHWSQCQMQSGVTGINTLRIYNPVKQAADHDPKGIFIRRWIPEFGQSAYPAPVVDHAEAVRLARARIAEFRHRTGMREQIAEVTRKHGSRKKPPAGRKKVRQSSDAQRTLFD